LVDIATKTPESAPNPQREHATTLAKQWLQRAGIDTQPPDKQYGYMTLVRGSRCPGPCNGEGNNTFALQVFDDRIHPSCYHNRCQGFNWESVLGKCPIEQKPWFSTFRELQTRVSEKGERPLLIDELLRQGDTFNIIAASKVGKTHLEYQLATSVASGTPWLGFPVKQGKVLIVDNELHGDSIVRRLNSIREAMQLPESVMDNISVSSLRGQLKTLPELCSLMNHVEAGTFSLVLIDALYRTLPKGMDENSNADIASLYNMLDDLARRQKCSCGSVHHASKGKQGGKAVTDVGSGAGAQSRAVDLHIVLRPHGKPGHLIFDAAVRDFPPIASRVIVQDYPLWHLAPEIDPSQSEPYVNLDEFKQWLEPGDHIKEDLETKLRERFGLNRKLARQIIADAVQLGIVEDHRPHKQKHFVRKTNGEVSDNQ
jgi:hypothetical protein